MDPCELFVTSFFFEVFVVRQKSFTHYVWQSILVKLSKKQSENAIQHMLNFDTQLLKLDALIIYQQNFDKPAITTE